MRIRIWGVVCVAILLFPAVSSANGLVVEANDNGMDEGAGPSLSVLQTLDLEVDVQDDLATLREVRLYRQPSPDGETEVQTFTFHRSLTDEGSRVVEFSVNGGLYEGEILPPQEADAYRMALVTQLQDAGPLREMGQPLFVSAPVEIALEPWGGSLEVGLTIEESLVSRATMQALSIPLDWHSAPIGSVSATVSAETTDELRVLYSPFHDLAVTRDTGNRMTAFYSGYNVCTSLDMTLFLSTGDDPYHLDILPFRDNAEEGGFFQILLTPPTEAPENGTVARDLVFVVDTSGSMEGEKMAQAKEALLSVLEGLTDLDSFAIVSFSGIVNTYLDDAVLAAEPEIEAARVFVDGLRADGSTNLYDAIGTGFSAMPLGTDHLRYLVVLTDGIPTEGEIDIEAILTMAQQRNEIGARIFAFGIGNDVNTVLLDRLAIDSSGDAIYIRPGQSVATAVETFFSQIASPTLTDPLLDFSAFGATMVYPEVMPDLFAGQTVMLLGRYDTGGDAQVFLRGVRNGASEAVVYDVTLPSYAVANGHTPRIWATRHVGTLFQQVKLGDTNPALVEEALQFADRYGVVTEFTYYHLDETGNVRLTYSEVPTDVSGSVAVDTSSSLDGYQNSGSVAVDTPQDGYMKYIRDRSLPLLEGWYTDTALNSPSDWVDIHFASARYFDFAVDEADLGAGSFLSLGRNLRFELRGRPIRITDAADPDREEIPSESVEVPAPDPHSTDMGTAVTMVELLTGAAAEGPTVGVPELEDPDLGAASPAGCGCTSTGNRAAPTMWLALVGTALFIRRRRRTARLG